MHPKNVSVSKIFKISFEYKSENSFDIIMEEYFKDVTKEFLLHIYAKIKKIEKFWVLLHVQRNIKLFHNFTNLGTVIFRKYSRLQRIAFKIFMVHKQPIIYSETSFWLCDSASGKLPINYLTRWHMPALPVTCFLQNETGQFWYHETNKQNKEN